MSTLVEEPPKVKERFKFDPERHIILGNTFNYFSSESEEEEKEFCKPTNRSNNSLLSRLRNGIKPEPLDINKRGSVKIEVALKTEEMDPSFDAETLAFDDHSMLEGSSEIDKTSENESSDNEAGEDHVCEYCPKTFPNRQSKYYHKIKEHKELYEKDRKSLNHLPTSYKCRHCHKTYSSAKSRWNHERNIHTRKSGNAPRKSGVSRPNEEVIYRHGTLTRPLKVELKDTMDNFTDKEACSTSMIASNEMDAWSNLGETKPLTRRKSQTNKDLSPEKFSKLNTPSTEATEPCEKCGKKFRGLPYLKRHLRYSTTCGSNITANSNLSANFTPSISESVKRHARSSSAKSDTSTAFDSMDAWSNLGDTRKPRRSRKSIAAVESDTENDQSSPEADNEVNQEPSTSKSVASLMSDEPGASALDAWSSLGDSNTNKKNKSTIQTSIAPINTLDRVIDTSASNKVEAPTEKEKPAPPSFKLVSCDKCGKKFAGLPYLTRHLNSGTCTTNNEEQNNLASIKNTKSNTTENQPVDGTSSAEEVDDDIPSSNVSNEDSDEEEEVSAWFNLGKTKTTKRKPVEKKKPINYDDKIVPSVSEEVEASAILIEKQPEEASNAKIKENEELLLQRMAILQQIDSIKSSDEDEEVGAWSNIGKNNTKKRKLVKTKLSPNEEDIQERNVSNNPNSDESENDKTITGIDKSPTSSSDELDEGLSAWANLGTPKTRKRKLETSNITKKKEKIREKIAYENNRQEDVIIKETHQDITVSGNNERRTSSSEELDDGLSAWSNLGTPKDIKRKLETSNSTKETKQSQKALAEENIQQLVMIEKEASEETTVRGTDETRSSSSEEPDEGLSAWANLGTPRTRKRKLETSSSTKKNEQSQEKLSNENIQEYLIEKEASKETTVCGTTEPVTSSSDELDKGLSAWANLGTPKTRKRKAEQGSFTKQKEQSREVLAKENVEQSDKAEKDAPKKLMVSGIDESRSSSSDELDEGLSAWANLGTPKARKRKTENKIPDSAPMLSPSALVQVEQYVDARFNVNSSPAKRMKRTTQTGSPQVNGNLSSVATPKFSNEGESKPLACSPKKTGPTPSIPIEVIQDDDDDDIQFIEIVPATNKPQLVPPSTSGSSNSNIEQVNTNSDLNQSTNSNSSMAVRNDIEMSPIPLSAAIFTKALLHPKEIMVVWCEILEEDLIAAANMNPANTILCIEDLETFRQSDSIKEVLKKSEMISFNVLKSDDSTSQWTLIAFFELGPPSGLANKLLMGYDKVEDILTKHAISKEMNLVNLMRYSKEGLFTHLPHRLTGKVTAYNCLQ